mgnify:FL=1
MSRIYYCKAKKLAFDQCHEPLVGSSSSRMGGVFNYSFKCQVLRLESQILWFSMPAPSSWFNLHSSGAILTICPKFFCHEFPNTEESTVMSSLESLAPPKRARMIIHYGSFTFKSLCGFGDLCKRFPILKHIKYSKNKMTVRSKELALLIWLTV